MPAPYINLTRYHHGLQFRYHTTSRRGIRNNFESACHRQPSNQQPSRSSQTWMNTELHQHSVQHNSPRPPPLPSSLPTGGKEEKKKRPPDLRAPSRDNPPYSDDKTCMQESFFEMEKKFKKKIKKLKIKKMRPARPHFSAEFLRTFAKAQEFAS